ncbi:MAG: hypothetical protein JXK07_00190 [Spirochaetes bacterium]|nr:hypothetical protein [Spirochaetota bacterium]MBN2770910.1 hypothetical protein [Spirochaetota bacterium]HRX16995.1 hypothetical protein [Spirochaetota bacterium]
MIIPLDKLNALESNKFVFTKGAMMTVMRLNKIKNYPEPDLNWKIVPNVLKLVLNEEIHYQKNEMRVEKKD